MVSRKIIFLPIFLLIQCQDEKKVLTEQILTLETAINEQPSQENLQKLLDLYRSMALRTESTEMLNYQWKAAETARAVRNFALADSLLTGLSGRKEDLELSAKALFLQAFMYDEDLDQIERARTLYERFIAEFPDHDFADDAQFLLDNLGKSEQEMLETLQQLQKQNAEIPQ